MFTGSQRYKIFRYTYRIFTIHGTDPQHTLYSRQYSFQPLNTIQTQHLDPDIFYPLRSQTPGYQIVNLFVKLVSCPNGGHPRRFGPRKKP